MNLMKKKYFILFAFVIIIILVFSISITVFSRSDSNILEEKLNQEINYLDTEILSMINSLNNITFSNSALLKQNSIKTNKSSNQDNNENNSNSNSNEVNSDYTKYDIENQNILIQNSDEIDWNYLKDSIETLYSSWPTIMIDLNNGNVKNDDILEFSRYLDSLVINVQIENKRATLNDLASMYGLIPIYVEQFSNDTNKINVNYTKSYIVNSCTLLEDDNWQEMQNQIKNANEYFSVVINSVKDQKRQSNINKAYISLNEMHNVINLKNKKLFYLKYINLMESLITI